MTVLENVDVKLTAAEIETSEDVDAFTEACRSFVVQYVSACSLETAFRLFRHVVETMEIEPQEEL